MLSLAELRHRHARFLFDQVEIQTQDQGLQIVLGYQLEAGPRFTTRLFFPHLTTELLASRDQNLVRLWAAHIGMIEGLSYWKAACSPEWVIDVPGITLEQLPFWESLLKKGLSEFFFINQVNAWEPGFISFTIANKMKLFIPKDQQPHQRRALVPVGGGKDSVVTTELLRTQQLPMTTFSINQYPQLEKVVDIFGKTKKSHLTVTRSLDSQLLELNKQGYLNGHTPFSSMVAFVSTLAAYLYDYQYVPLSNEWSANEGNTIFHGQTINHQYSKTVEFEQLFRSHLATYLSTTVEYFSFLRPLHELQIAELFTQYPKYWPAFLSCNRGQRKGIWCGECPKCLFVAIMLSAFLSQEQLLNIFGKDILNNQSLTDIFDQLAGFTEVKSLECVGTRDETQAAIALAKQHLSPTPALIEYGWQKLLTNGQTAEHLLQQAAELRISFAQTHFLPVDFAMNLQQAVKNLHD